MKLIFERGAEGRGLSLLPACDVPEACLPEAREIPLHLPQVSENELLRHYTALCKQVYGVNDGFYPLGSCTMKYNPKIDEEMAALPGFTQLHPLQPVETVQGALEALHLLGRELREILGMDEVTFQPAAGAHGELTGVILCYYDGANLNAIMGIVRPGDMGFDCVHSNLHKTFATPHGGGGPGAGAVGCKSFLRPYMPGPLVVERDGQFDFDIPEKSAGRVKSFYGNFTVAIKALTYILTLGRQGISEAAKHAVLNANYMKARLSGTYDMAYPGLCMHEFVMSLAAFHQETGCTALDLAKGMLDCGMHPPTMYFPLIVHEALMVEPCETESKDAIDEACEIYLQLHRLGYEVPQALHSAPSRSPVGRLDEVAAARNLVLRHAFL